MHPATRMAVQDAAVADRYRNWCSWKRSCAALDGRVAAGIDIPSALTDLNRPGRPVFDLFIAPRTGEPVTARNLQRVRFASTRPWRLRHRITGGGRQL